MSAHARPRIPLALAVASWLLLVGLVAAFSYQAVTLTWRVDTVQRKLVTNVSLLVEVDHTSDPEALLAVLQEAGRSDLSGALVAGGTAAQARQAVRERLRGENAAYSGALARDWRTSRRLTLGAVGLAAAMVVLATILVLGYRRRLRLQAELSEARAREVAAEAERALLQRLEATNDRLERFAAAVSHDLRAPLRAMVAFAQLAAMLDLPDEAREHLDRVISHGARMRGMLEGLLRVARAGMDTSERVDLEAVARHAVEHVAAELADAGGTVETGPLPAVWGSSAALTSVLQNLLQNAVRYRSPERALRVRVDSQIYGDRAVVEVADNGRGVRPEMREAVFDLFTRDASGGDAKGSGVGLALCRALVESMGGTIHLGDAAPGTIVVLELPLQPPPETPVARPPVEPPGR